MTSNQPKDYVKPEERTEPRTEPGGDRYAEQIGDAVNLLGKPKPELLWVLLLVIVIEGAQLWEADARVENTKAIWGQMISQLEATEQNRAEEMRRAQESIKELSRTLGRSAEAINTTSHRVFREAQRPGVIVEAPE